MSPASRACFREGSRSQRPCFRLGAREHGERREEESYLLLSSMRPHVFPCLLPRPAVAVSVGDDEHPPEFVERRIAVPDLPHGVAAELSAVEVGEPLVNGSHVFLPSTFPCPCTRLYATHRALQAANEDDVGRVVDHPVDATPHPQRPE